MLKIFLEIIRDKEVFLLLLFCLIIVFILHTTETSLHIQQSHMIDLAESLLKGKLTVNLLPNHDDLSYYHGKYYVYFGFFPSLLLLPLILLFYIQNQWGLVPICTLISARCFYLIGRYLGLSAKKSIWTTIAFYFGTVYLFLALVDITAFYIQVLGNDFLVIALYIFICKKRIFPTALLFCFSFLTRPTLFLAIVFFFIEFVIEKQPLQTRIKKIILFSLPVIFSLGSLLVYNYLRFGSFFNNGYASNIAMVYTPAVAGIFSPKYIPTNLYYLFFKGIDAINVSRNILRFPYYKADPMGLGIFFTSPFFFYALFADVKEKYIISSLVTILLIGITVLSFYASGFWQYGYRYALDFYPFLFIILISVFVKYFTNVTKVVILYSICFNSFFMFSIWGIYPFIPKL